MKSRQLNVSKEYLDELCDDMAEWADKKDSWAVPQFLQSRGISYKYFKYFCWQYPRVDAFFEVLKAKLNYRWLIYGLTNDNVPPHKAKMLLRYLRLYDSHAIDMEDDARERASELESRLSMQAFMAENYEGEELVEPYRTGFEKNLNKGRGSEEAE